MQAFEKQIIRSANFFNLRPSDFLTKILSGNILGMLGGSPTSPTNLNPFTGFSSTPAFQMKKNYFLRMLRPSRTPYFGSVGQETQRHRDHGR